MFKLEYQGGTCVEVFSAQGKEGKHSLWKFSSSGIKQRVFDKEVKSFIFTLEGSTSSTKVQLPKEVKQSLGLTQGIVVLQINVPLGVDLAVELGVLDSADQKCRLAFSTAFRETHVTALHVKIPLALIKRDVWLNLCIDLPSLVRENLRTSHKSLESICVSGSCRLRRIFTMRNQPLDTTDDDKLYNIREMNANGTEESIPKQCQLASDVHHLTQVINATKLRCYEGKDRASLLSTARTAPSHDTDTSLSMGTNDLPAAYCIAFGSRVPVPNRRPPLKEGNTTSRLGSVHQNLDISPDCMASNALGRNDIASREKLAEGLTGHKRSGPESNAKDQLLNVAGNWKEGSVVKPHPPRKPSSEKSTRRRPRVKSSSNDSTAAAAAGNSSDGVVGSDLSEYVKADVTSQTDVHRVSSEAEKLNLADEAFDSESDSTDSEEYNVLIKNLNPNELKNGNAVNLNKGSKGNKVYVFSSRPTCIDDGRTRKKHPRKQGLASAPLHKGHHFDTKLNNRRRPASENTPRSLAVVSPDVASSVDGDFEFSDASAKDAVKRSQPKSIGGGGGGGRPAVGSSVVDGVHQSPFNSQSQTRQSVNRKSLREIPAEELQQSGGQKPYSCTKYKEMGDVTDSYEWQMLRSLQREAASDAAVDSEDERPSNNLPFGYDTLTDSSDDLSTLKSPKLLKNRSHNYQEEISHLGQSFMMHSNPRDWANAFSPPILPHSSTSKKPFSDKETHEYSKLVHPHVSEELKENGKHEAIDTDEELDLLYDPELRYFYDPRTTKYYEMITPCSSHPRVNELLK